MEVSFSNDLQGRLAHLAAERGCDAGTLVVEAVERLMDYDQWFTAEVQKGIAAADRGEFVEHEEVAALIRERYRLNVHALDETSS